MNDGDFYETEKSVIIDKEDTISWALNDKILKEN